MAAIVEGNVGAANTGCLHFNQNVIVTDFGDGDIPQLGLAGAIAIFHYCFHVIASL